MKILMAAIVLFAGSGACFAQACMDTPYTVQSQSTQGTITVTLPPALANDSAKPPSVKASAEYSRTMYAAMGPTVVREVLQSYTCKVEQAIDADATKTAEQKVVIKDAWRNAVNDLTTTAAIYFGAFKVDLAQAQELNPVALQQSLDADGRSPAPYLSVLKAENFLIQNSYSAYLTGTFNGISATACGSYLKAALAANAGMIQHLAAAVLPMLNTYFENKRYAPRNAKVILYGEAPSVLMATQPSDAKSKADLAKCTAL